MKTQIYGPSSEKRAVAEVSPDQGRLLFNEAEAVAHSPEVTSAPESVSIQAHSRKKSGRKPLPQDLPRIEVVHDLAEDQKQCSRCNRAEAAARGVWWRTADRWL